MNLAERLRSCCSEAVNYDSAGRATARNELRANGSMDLLSGGPSNLGASVSCSHLQSRFLFGLKIRRKGHLVLRLIFTDDFGVKQL